MLGSTAKRYGKVIFYPFIILLLPFIALGIGIVLINGIVSGIFHRVRWLRDLRTNGRVTPAAMLLSNANGGTLIVDRPGFNFKSTHCWWTNENVADVSPVPIPTDDERLALCTETNATTPHDFDLWCWKRYISPLTGSATLVAPPHHGEAFANTIRERLPDLGLVSTWSAIPALQSRASNGTEQSREPENAS